MNSQVKKEKYIFLSEDGRRRRKLFNVTLKVRLVNVNYNFEGDWFSIELSSNKLFENNLGSQ